MEPRGWGKRQLARRYTCVLEKRGEVAATGIDFARLHVLDALKGGCGEPVSPLGRTPTTCPPFTHEPAD